MTILPAGCINAMPMSPLEFLFLPPCLSVCSTVLLPISPQPALFEAFMNTPEQPEACLALRRALSLPQPLSSFHLMLLVKALCDHKLMNAMQRWVGLGDPRRRGECVCGIQGTVRSQAHEGHAEVGVSVGAISRA